MVPDLRSSDTDSPCPESWPEPAGGVSPEFDQAALYEVINAAVKDALLDGIGMLLLPAIAFVGEYLKLHGA